MSSKKNVKVARLNPKGVKAVGEAMLTRTITDAVSAVRILLEIENVNRFSTAKKITAYFGVHPTFKQSGDGTWNIKMSKKGRSEIRAVLYMCCLSAIRYDDNFRQLKQVKKKKPEHYKKDSADAPISRYAAQRRKKQETSQSSQLEESTGSVPAEAKVLKS